MRRTTAWRTVLTAEIHRAAAAAAPACILDRGGSYLFANEAWQRLESRRRGLLQPDALVGTSFVDALESDDLRCGWRGVFEQVLSRAAPRVVTGEDNTPAMARLTSTRVEPITCGRAVLALALTRSTVRERPLSELYAVSQRSKEAYVGADGRTTMCACCRRARDGADPEHWEIVPGWVAAPPASARWVTCALCAELHLGRAPVARDAA